ncbi:MAG: hypothetical protein ABSA48_10115 [Terracidiphilus sp.]
MSNKIRWITKMLSVLVLAISVCSVEANAQKSMLTPSDLTFVGAFLLPSAQADVYGCCLALRIVNGQVHLFTAGGTTGQGQGYLYEIAAPTTLTTTPPWNTATLVTDWSNGNTVNNFPNASAGTPLFGLYWDSNVSNSRLYYSVFYGAWGYYTGSDPYMPSLSFLTLNANGTTTSDGLWGLANRSVKMVWSGLVGVPSDFQSQYSVGPLAAGFGGYFSVMATGPVSMGPCLAAFTPPTAGTGSNDEVPPCTLGTETCAASAYLPSTPLVGYPFVSTLGWDSGQYPTGQNFAWRPDDYFNDFPMGIETDTTPTSESYNGGGSTILWNPYTSGSTFDWQGYSTTSSSRALYPTVGNSQIIHTRHWVPGNAFWGIDYIYQTGAWIQTADREGFVLLPQLTTGRARYEDSNLGGDAFEFNWMIYSRAQLASVATGAVAQDAIQPAHYPAQFPGVPTPAIGTEASGYLGTSTTQMTLGIGTYTFTTQAGLAYTPGMYVSLTETTDANNYCPSPGAPDYSTSVCNTMTGVVTAYSGTSMTINTSGEGLGYQGSGTFSNWLISGGPNGNYYPTGVTWDSTNDNLYVLFNNSTNGSPVIFEYHVD